MVLVECPSFGFMWVVSILDITTPSTWSVWWSLYWNSRSWRPECRFCDKRIYDVVSRRECGIFHIV